MAEKEEDEIVTDVARRISEIRLGQGLTQEAAAERLRMSLKGYQRIERGLQNLTLKRLARVAAMLGVRPMDLLSVPASREVRKGRPRR
jgi:transcriptional regulator with XRE-family HTH domain